MLADIASSTLLGVDGHPVVVEVHVSSGLPAFTIVGLPDAACRESRDRVRAALLSSGLPWPNTRVTVNLAPSGLRKGGAGLDLPIAIGLLVALGELDAELVKRCGFLGELGLDGTLRSVPGVVALVDALDSDAVVVPAMCAAEAELVGRYRVRSAGSLGELIAALRGEIPWPDPPPQRSDIGEWYDPDLIDVRGQPVARLALEVAAAGGHHLLMIGPPGSGKTMLARRLPGILPDLNASDALEATRVRSAAGLSLLGSGLVRRPPLRAPHHGASAVSLLGGGTSAMRPGEISLACHGVLFLDEMGEFPVSVLDSLRQPLEEGVIRVARARACVTYPARFLLVAAMNPCPCGMGASSGMCRCSDAARARYARRLSGPLLDRLDIRIDVMPPDPSDLLTSTSGESSAQVAERVRAARERAAERGVLINAQLDTADLDRYAPLSPDAKGLLEHELRAGSLSARGLNRVRRVACTLADLGGRSAPMQEEDICFALQLRAEPSLVRAA
ncbi:MAG: YifB family Mg chelatase-like AAA ATPase [Acidimicrobiales bacterium]